VEGGARVVVSVIVGVVVLLGEGLGVAVDLAAASGLRGAAVLRFIAVVVEMVLAREMESVGLLCSRSLRFVYAWFGHLGAIFCKYRSRW
jgi:hypothetical protein